MVRIERDADGTRVEDCLSLARELDEGFNENGLDSMAEQLPSEQTLLAVDEDGDLLGFASLAEQGPDVAELSWLAVKGSRQGNGIGTRLLGHVYSACESEGVRLLTVKTLADTVTDENYERARRFYEKEGFLHVETIDPYPDWDPGNPCAIYVRPITADDL